MRPRRRPGGSPHKRAVPARSRLTVRASASAPLARGVGLRDALQASREALMDIEGRLEALLRAVRAPAGAPRLDDVDQLARAAGRATAAIANLTKA